MSQKSQSTANDSNEQQAAESESESEIDFEDEITYEPVVAWAIVQSTRTVEKGDETVEMKQITASPIACPVTDEYGQTQFDYGSTSVGPASDVIGVVPDTMGTFQVLAPIGNSVEVIGYKYQGASNPDFVEIAERVHREVTKQ